MKKCHLGQLLVVLLLRVLSMRGSLKGELALYTHIVCWTEPIAKLAITLEICISIQASIRYTGIWNVSDLLVCKQTIAIVSVHK